MGGNWTQARARTCALVASMAVAIACVFAPGAQAATAPPARPAEVSACNVQRTEAAKTAEIAQPVYGAARIGGCVADTSGIAHLLLTWEAEADNAHGRICTDPSVIDGAWSCVWDSSRLPLGDYTVHMVAVDEAGNRGTFDRAYEVVEPPAPDPEAPVPDEAPTPQEGTEGTNSPPPAASDDTQATPPAGPVPAPDAAPAPDLVPGPAAEPEPTPDPEQPAPPATLPEPHPDPLALARTLALQRLADCAREGVEGAETDATEVISQVEQAAVVRDCIAPALEALGADDVAVDSLPVPPQLWVVFADEAAVRAALPDLPVAVAGVPLRIMTAEQRTQLEAERAAAAPAAPADPATP